MASVPGWVWIWLVISNLLCLWDGAFVLSRPRSFPGGDLHKYWPGYDKYIAIDRRYMDTSDGFGKAQVWMNFAEGAIYVAAFLQQGRSRWTWLLVGAVATFWKTVAYFGSEAVNGFSDQAETSRFDFWAIYLGPGVLWIIVPFFIFKLSIAVLSSSDSQKKMQ